ncbi:MAG: recombinase family protein [Eubacteriaceae bacterium]|nr:recombinase family protein [Eubacteriaceae bacterium]
MAKNITFIPARNDRGNLATSLAPRKKRVAAYCRVSTDQLEQKSSYSAQVEFYSNYITSNPDYELAGIFADEGLSGTSTKKREQFNRMIEECKVGKIDMLITKSISRFARNTLDCLNYVRLLKDLGIGIIFEKENIDTLDSKGEVLLSILSSLAQDESRSISENCTWGIRRRFEQGKVRVNHTKFLGYDKDQEGNLVIDKKQAEIVKRIYTDFLNGKGTTRIAKELEMEKVPKWDGGYKWYESSVRKILTNEKYKGDALLQKTYTVDFLSKKRAENDGDVPQYYVENSHPAIIDKDIWEAVQLEFERRKKFSEEHGIQKYEQSNDKNPFASRVICGKCGLVYGRKVWNSTDSHKRHIWQCNSKYKIKGKICCDNRHIDEKDLEQAFVEAFNEVVENKAEYIEKWMRDLGSKDVLKKVTAKRFIGIFEDADPMKEFDGEIWSRLGENITINTDKGIIVRLLDGTEIG